MEAFRCL